MYEITNFTEDFPMPGEALQVMMRNKSEKVLNAVEQRS